MKTFKTKRFVLRPFRHGDEKSLQKSVNDPIIARNTAAIPYPYTMSHAKYWIKKCEANKKQKHPESVAFAVDIGGEVVGAVGLHKIEDGHKAELGYWLAKKYRGQGIIPEAAKIVTRYAFDSFKLHRIYGYVDTSNEPSKRVFEKLGFTLEGILHKNAHKHGKYKDQYLFAKYK